MRTDLIYIDTIPDEPTLTALLGVKLYSCHSILCKIATSVLAPDIERWTGASRRGKYYHGYIIEKWPLSREILSRLYNREMAVITGYVSWATISKVRITSLQKIFYEDSK